MKHQSRKHRNTEALNLLCSRTKSRSVFPCFSASVCVFDMSELTDLYQEVILDHNRRPHNFRVIESPSAKQEGFNPLCGDRLTLYLTLDGDVIKDVAFQGRAARSRKPRRR